MVNTAHHEIESFFQLRHTILRKPLIAVKLVSSQSAPQRGHAVQIWRAYIITYFYCIIFPNDAVNVCEPNLNANYAQFATYCQDLLNITLLIEVILSLEVTLPCFDDVTNHRLICLRAVFNC